MLTIILMPTVILLSTSNPQKRKKRLRKPERSVKLKAMPRLIPKLGITDIMDMVDTTDTPTDTDTVTWENAPLMPNPPLLLNLKLMLNPKLGTDTTMVDITDIPTITDTTDILMDTTILERDLLRLNLHHSFSVAVVLVTVVNQNLAKLLLE